MGNLNYLNFGCGSKYHTDWVNIDIKSNSEFVISHNILNGFPFRDNTFEAIYSSQVLEHFDAAVVPFIIKDCYRICKDGGIIRLVVPDLENIVKEYLKNLEIVNKSQDEINIANYEWIILEMFDQISRNYSGGKMIEYLKNSEIINKEYIIHRIGYIGRSLLENQNLNHRTQDDNKFQKRKLSSKIIIQKIKNIKSIRRLFLRILLSKDEKKYIKIGRFRLGGEIHYNMFDRYSLSKILCEAGFTDISIKSPFDSDIKNWNQYELDIKNSEPYDPISLFIEAKKQKI